MYQETIIWLRFKLPTQLVTLNKRFERYTNDLNEEQKKDLKQKWASFRNIASSKQRLEAIVFDIEDHFNKNVKGQGFKAMLATNSKAEAIRFKELFDEGGNIVSAVSISEANVGMAQKQPILVYTFKIYNIYGKYTVYRIQFF